MATLLNLIIGNWMWLLLGFLVLRELIKLNPSQNANDILKWVVNKVLVIYDYFTMPNLKAGGGFHVPNLWAWILGRF